MKKNFTIAVIGLILLATNGLFGQISTKLSISFIPMYDAIPLSLESPNYPIGQKDSVVIEIFKLYISNIELFDGAKRVFAEANSHHLLDASEPNSLVFELDIPENLAFSRIQFNLGIDSLTNMAGAMGGDLDPAKGMYWTWQSGYINFKMEGKSSLCDTRNNVFAYHLGGYAFPNNSLQRVDLKFEKNRDNQSISIKMDVQKFLSQIDLTTQNRLMSLGQEAVELAAKATHIFTIIP